MELFWAVDTIGELRIVEFDEYTVYLQQPAWLDVSRFRAAQPTAVLVPRELNGTEVSHFSINVRDDCDLVVAAESRQDSSDSLISKVFFCIPGARLSSGSQ